MRVPNPVRLPSGNYRCQFTIDGKRYSTTAETKKDAQFNAMQMIIEGREPTSNITLKRAYERYIAAKDGVLSPSTIASYERLSRNTMQGLMDLSLDKITEEKIQREISAMSMEKSPKYVANASGLLRAVLRMFNKSFDYSVTLPQKKKIRQRALSVDEIKALYNEFKATEMELPYLMGVWLGMRLSEIRGARKEDIQGNRLHICRAIIDDKDGNPIIKPPKTFNGDRWVDFPPYLQSLVRGDDYLVALSGQAIYKRLTRACDKVGITRCRFHDLRHTNASIMISLGISSKVAQERNGWASERMYKQVYGYVMQQDFDESSSAINEFFQAELHTDCTRHF